MTGFSDPILTGDGSLIRVAAKSPNFVSGTSGWSINRDGSAEFNNLLIRGSVVIQGTNGLFVYSGVPALGNLIVAIASQAGVDSFGNAYGEGVSIVGGLLALKEISFNVAPPHPAAGNLGIFSYTDGSVRLVDSAGRQVFIANPFSANIGFSTIVNDTTTETVIASVNVPALESLAPATNNVYELNAGGDLTTDTTPGTLVCRVRTGGVGGTNVATAGAVTPAASQSGIGVSFRALVNINDNDDGSNTAFVAASATMSCAALPSGVLVARNPSVPWVPVNVPDTSSFVLVLTFQWFTARPNNTLQTYFSESRQVA